MKKALSLHPFLLAAFLGSDSLAAQDRWDEAARRIRYLSPAELLAAPPGVVRALEDRACRIPQEWSDSLPHNVIRGEFARRGQEDWAILCSRAGVSQILVFWNRGDGGVDSLAPHEDKSFLQTVESDRIGFSRRIGIADDTARDHQGIDDAFVEKGSRIFYYTEGEWLELAGAD